MQAAYGALTKCDLRWNIFATLPQPHEPFREAMTRGTTAHVVVNLPDGLWP
jgi:hypothetical protein